MRTPALSHYQRVIVTKRPATCHTCGQATIVGQDYAAVTADKRWHAYCRPCASSFAAQAAGLTQRLESLATACEAEGIPTDNLPLPDEARLIAVIQDTGSSFGYDVAQALLTSLACLQARKVTADNAADPIIEGLRKVAADESATARDRGFAADLVRWSETRGPLTEGQRKGAERMLAKRGNGSRKLAPGVYVDASGRFVKVRKARQHDGVYSLLWMGNGWDYQPALLGDTSLRPITADEAAAFGHQHEQCVFCSTPLSDDGENRSVQVGYGPICAQRYGLPWG